MAKDSVYHEFFEDLYYEGCLQSSKTHFILFFWVTEIRGSINLAHVTTASQNMY